METALKKDINILRDKINYLTKEGARLRAIIDEREDDIRILLQGGKDFEIIRSKIFDLRKSLIGINETTDHHLEG